MIRKRPVTAGVPVTQRVFLARFPEDQIGIQMHGASFHVDARDDEILHIVRKWRGPEELTGGTIECEDASAFPYHYRNIPLLAPTDVGIDPFHEARVGIDHG